MKKLTTLILIVFLLACWRGECKRRRSEEIEKKLFKEEYSRLRKLYQEQKMYLPK